jgi:hypothetical protein
MVSSEWNGLDTLIITAGVLSVLSLMEVASTTDKTRDSRYNSTDGLANLCSVAQRSLEANSLGPMLSAATFVRIFILHILYTPSPLALKLFTIPLLCIIRRYLLSNHPQIPPLSSFFPLWQPSFLRRQDRFMRPQRPILSCVSNPLLSSIR